MSKQAHPTDMQREFEAFVKRVAKTPVNMRDANGDPIASDKQRVVQDLFPEFPQQLQNLLNPLKKHPDYLKTSDAARKDFLSAFYHLTTNLVHDILDDVLAQPDAPASTLSQLAKHASPSLSISFNHYFAFQVGSESSYFKEQILPRIHFYNALNTPDIVYLNNHAQAIHDRPKLKKLFDEVIVALKEKLGTSPDAEEKVTCMQCLCDALLKSNFKDQFNLATLSTQEKAELIISMQTLFTTAEPLSDLQSLTNPSGDDISACAKMVHGLFSSETALHSIDIFPSGQHAEQPAITVQAASASRALITSSQGKHHQATLDMQTGRDPRVVSLLAVRERHDIAAQKAFDSDPGNNRGV